MDKKINTNPQVKYVQTADSEVLSENWGTKFHVSLVLFFLSFFGVLGYFSVTGDASSSDVEIVDFETAVSVPTSEPTDEVPSCASGAANRNCGSKVCTPTSCCSCHSTCEEKDNCCHDYEETCRITPSPTDEVPSCSSGRADRNCGFNICTSSSCCSCDSDCEKDDTCCHDYDEICRITPSPTEEVPSCASGSAERNCGNKICTATSCCSCNSDCEEDDTCCHDYDETCRITPSPTEEAPSCSSGPTDRNCGFKICTATSCCSCDSDCEEDDTCCHDYDETCRITPSPTDEVPSCASGAADRNCGLKVCTRNSCCSCDSDCEEDDTCCHDYDETCRITPSPTDEVPSCSSGPRDRHCGLKICTPTSCCSCDSDCEETDTCCHDYDETCRITPSPTNEVPSCASGPSDRSCGYNVCTPTSCCSCETNCEEEGRCCHDYSETCRITPSPTDEVFGKLHI